MRTSFTILKDIEEVVVEYYPWSSDTQLNFTTCQDCAISGSRILIVLHMVLCFDNLLQYTNILIQENLEKIGHDYLKIDVLCGEGSK